MNKELIPIFKSLSDETRVEIVRRLIATKEMSCQQLSEYFGLSQPTLSHHFKKLVDAGVLNERKESIWIYYSINYPMLKKVGLDLKKVLS
jgi:ArsR family transcriptional regulator